MASAYSKFTKGVVVRQSDTHFLESLTAAVDYRGDVSIIVSDGSVIEGYIFNSTHERVDLFPKNSPRAVSVLVKEIDTLTFSGEDTASGKSWDDWVKKKEAERAVIKAQPLEA